MLWWLMVELRKVLLLLVQVVMALLMRSNDRDRRKVAVDLLVVDFHGVSFF